MGIARQHRPRVADVRAVMRTVPYRPLAMVTKEFAKAKSIRKTPRIDAERLVNC